MKELGWQLNRNKYTFLLTFLVFGAMLGPIFVILGDDTVTEAVYRIVMLFVGICAMTLYGERQGILRRKNYGASFYRSMTNGLEKERKRWLVLDTFLCVLGVVVFATYKCIGELIQGGFNGNAVICILLLYLAGNHLFVKHPIGMICITMFALVFLGMSHLVTVPIWGVGIAWVVFICCEAIFFKSLKKLWEEE